MDMAREAMRTLANAAFPVYLLAPDQWTGDVFFSGAWGEDKDPLATRLLHVPDAGVRPWTQGVEVITIGPRGVAHISCRDLTDQRCYRNEIVNFLTDFAQVPSRPLPGAVRYDNMKQPETVILPSAGPRQLLPAFDLGIAGRAVLERVVFDEHPELRMCRITLGECDIILLSWNIDETAITSFARGLVPMRAGTALFREFEAREVASWQRIRKGSIN